MTAGVDQLQAAIAGEVITPADSGWDAARQAWNLSADQHPELVVLAESAGDVVATARFAADNGLRVAPQSTGHGATSMGGLGGAILLRTSRLNAVDVDADARTARVQAGARWNEVIAPAAAHGLVGLHGMSGGVGVAGYTLGGGIGWLARREGFASSHVGSFDLVTANGKQQHVDAEHEPDLFWALRGGGGGPAIVTSLELELFDLREAFVGSMVWPIEQASEIVHTYRAWIATVPDALTSTLKLVRVPPLPDVPDPLRGRALVSITIAFSGSAEQGSELVAPLRDTAPRYLDTLATVPAAALGDISGDPQDPLPGVGNAVLLDELTEEAADTFVELAGSESQTPLVGLEIRHLGGALRSNTADPGPAGPLQSEVLVYGAGVAATPEAGVANRDALNEVAERLSPWVSARRTLLTFDERGIGLRGSVAPEVADRLARINATYDPDGLLVANQVAR